MPDDMQDQKLEEYFAYKIDQLTEKAREKISEKVAQDKAIIKGYLEAKAKRNLSKKVFARSIGMPFGTFRHLCETYSEITIDHLNEAQSQRVQVANYERRRQKYIESALKKLSQSHA